MGRSIRWWPTVTIVWSSKITDTLYDIASSIDENEKCFLTSGSSLLSISDSAPWPNVSDFPSFIPDPDGSSCIPDLPCSSSSTYRLHCSKHLVKFWPGMLLFVNRIPTPMLGGHVYSSRTSTIMKLKSTFALQSNSHILSTSPVCRLSRSSVSVEYSAINRNPLHGDTYFNNRSVLKNRVSTLDLLFTYFGRIERLEERQSVSENKPRHRINIIYRRGSLRL